MDWLPLTATVEEYEAQAALLLRGHAQGDEAALRIIHENHPRLSKEETRSAPFDIDDARLALAPYYSYRDWAALISLVSAIRDRTPGVYEFESAAEAVITGDLAGLKTLIASNPELVHARSSRVTCHDPAIHRATLLHYVAANGVEGYRQRTPANAVQVARVLLQAGADPDALAGMYGGECAPLAMLVSSSPPAAAGVQTALTETLLDHGANPNGCGTGHWVSPLLTALVFGFRDAAEALARRGARVDSLAAASGLGRLASVEALLPAAEPLERHRALALAVQLGHVDVVCLLLDAGESPDRYNPEGFHAHATPLHQAALAGDDAVARLLVERGARLDIADKLWNSTPRGWAEYGGHPSLARYLRANER